MAKELQQPQQRDADSGARHDHTSSGATSPDPESGTRIDWGIMPGSDTAGVEPGGTNAASMGGGGVGGDIDRPDITGRGMTADATGDPDHGMKKGLGGGNLGPARVRRSEG